MNFKTKKVLVIDLAERSAEISAFDSLKPYVGGIGIGAKLTEIYKEHDPIVFSVGPLNGFFPFASKTAVNFLLGEKFYDLYFGGSLSFRIAYAGYDSIILLNSSMVKDTVIDVSDEKTSFLNPNETDLKSLGLPGKTSKITFNSEGDVLLDGNFIIPERLLEKKFVQKNIGALVVSGTKITQPRDAQSYSEIFKNILSKEELMTVEKDNYASCSGCPMGCARSKVGELGGSYVVHSLVACTYAEKIYNDVGIVFSCLNSLGYDYTHEDIENLPNLVRATIAEITSVENNSAV